MHKHTVSIGIIVGIIITFGFLYIPKYGVSWDEPFQRDTGILTWRYVIFGDQDLLLHKDRWYGTAFEFVLVAAEYSVQPIGSRAVFLLRHSLTYAFNAFGVVALYIFIFLGFRRHFYSVLAVLFFYLSPRISADMVYNSKDAVFLTAVCISCTVYAWYHQKPSSVRGMLLGLSAAFATSIRIIGIFLPCVFIALFLLDQMTRSTRIKHVHTMALMILMWAGGTYFLWPVLWHDPIGEFYRSFVSMSQFPWNGLVLFRGTFLSASHLPWYYIPWWILVSTPISILVLCGIGIGKACMIVRKNHTAWILLVWFGIPLLYVMVFRPVLYDGWRHLYFIYPALIGCSIMGIDVLQKTKPFIQKAVGLFIGIDLLIVCMFMVQQYPHHYLYMNGFSGGWEQAKKNYELDYWGLSLSEGIRYIATHDASANIIVYAPNTVGDPIAYMVPEKDRRRITISDSPVGAKYFIGNYRWHPKEYPFPYPPFYQRRINGIRIMGVWDISSSTIITEQSEFVGQ